MSTPDAYLTMLAALATHAGLDAEQLQERQELLIDDTVVVLSRAGDALECFCEVATFAHEPTAAQWQLLLQANTLGRPTQGATLGLLSSRDALLLGKRIPLDAPVAVAARACLDLAAMCLAWRVWLSQQNDGSSA